MKSERERKLHGLRHIQLKSHSRRSSPGASFQEGSSPRDAQLPALLLTPPSVLLCVSFSPSCSCVVQVLVGGRTRHSSQGCDGSEWAAVFPAPPKPCPDASPPQRRRRLFKSLRCGYSSLCPTSWHPLLGAHLLPKPGKSTCICHLVKHLSS